MKKNQLLKDDPGLTRREKEILEMFVEGAMSAKQVAHFFKLSVNTVNNHLKAIRRKMNAVSLIDLSSKYYKLNFWLIRKNPTEPTPVRTAKVISFNTFIQYKAAA